VTTEEVDRLHPASQAHSARSRTERETIGCANNIITEPGGVQSSGDGDGGLKAGEGGAARREAVGGQRRHRNDFQLVLEFVSVVDDRRGYLMRSRTDG